MKSKLLFSILSLAIYNLTCAQNLILNGSLETNTATVNTTNLHDWSTVVSNAWEIDGGTMDLLKTNSCGTASNGNWFVETSHNGIDYYTSFSLGLSTHLTVGDHYTLTFDKKVCSTPNASIDIGISNDSTLMGTFIHTFSAPTTNSWSSETYVFSAPIAGKFLTVNVQTSVNNSLVDLDNFVLTHVSTTGIDEIALQSSNIFPNPGNGLFSIHLKEAVQKAEVTIYNATGEKVVTTQMNSNKVEIDLSNKAKGIYFYTIMNEKGIVGQGKFFVQ